MTSLQIEALNHQPGAWRLSSRNPAVLAASCDALVQTINAPHDTLTAWALHPSEQDGALEQAYLSEREELHRFHPQPVTHIIETPRPWQTNVVWVDRYHLFVTSCPLAAGSRLLGLYVGTPGRIVVQVHDASVSATVQAKTRDFPFTKEALWRDANHVAQLRFAIEYSPQNPSQILLLSPLSMLPQIQTGLQQLMSATAHW